MKFQSHRKNIKPWWIKRFTLRSHAIFMCALIVLCIYHVSKNEKDVKAPFLDGHRATQRRVAIIMPFLSTSLVILPPYFPIFLQTARGSSSIVDFLVFHNGQLGPFINDVESTIQGFEIPTNVKFINLKNMRNFTSYFMRVIDKRLEYNHLKEDEMNYLSEMMSTLLQKYPYILVEFKPAMGHIFQDFIIGYSHWGYSDFDIVFGDLPRWITDEELDEWDIVTYSYGDQDRVYLRGQFTFHKNMEPVNNIWRKCSHLSKMDLRYKRMLQGKDKLQLVSAEGCYSSAVINTKNISVKYAVKALSDVKDRNDDSFEFGIAIATGTRRDKSVLYKAPKGPMDLKRFRGLSYTWFEHDKLYNSRDLQHEQGPKHLITEQHKQPPGCMYWVRNDYQMDLCYRGISSTDTVMLVNGQLFKQSFMEQQFPRGVISKAFFHFQDWKRSITAEQVAAFYRTTNNGYHHLGWHLFQEGAVEVVDTSIQGTRDAKTSKTKQNLPSHYYCLSSVGRKTHSTAECDYAISWRNENVSVNVSEDWHDVEESDVTLILTIQVGSTADSYDRAFSTESDSDRRRLKILLKYIESNVASWSDNPVLIIVYSSLSGELETYFRRRMDALLASRSRIFIGVIFGSTDIAINARALSNMAESACATRWILSGIDVNQGIVISQESLLFCKRAIDSFARESNVVFTLGQMMSSRENTNNIVERSVPLYSISDISKLHPIPGNEIQLQIHQVWEKLSMGEVKQKNGTDPSRGISLAEELYNLQVILLSALAGEQSNSLHFSKQPILLLDSKGHLGLPPQVIERWEQCSNGLRLSQLALIDYTIIPLQGAFVVYHHNLGNDQDWSHNSKFGIACKELSSMDKASIVYTAKLKALRELGLSPYWYVG